MAIQRMAGAPLTCFRLSDGKIAGVWKYVASVKAFRSP
ncbi:hypothetical protein BN135_1648 [Cronobacter muytjensii 530]